MRPGVDITAIVSVVVAVIGVAAQTACKTATVGQPNSNCFDIWTAADITQAQFMSYNPGIDCSALQPGQKVCISPGQLPSNAPKPNPDGSCHTYNTVSGDSCSAIAVKFDITTALIEQYNSQTYKWTGCAGLQVNFTMCVSSGTPPPIPVNPDLQCGPESPGNASCPLHACCSQFGFCGLTDDFCHTTQPNPCIRDCGEPTLPSCNGGQATQKLAYYAGWGNRRTPCSWANVSPRDIDWSGYTHVYFAFATISQAMQLQLAAEDEPLLAELVDLRALYPELQFVIAVGGWAFSTDDPTRDIFSVMVSSTDTRRTFIDSVEIFLNQYKLNGIDIDFEYPAAIERQGPPEDTPNLTQFFEELRARLSPSSFVISIAAPAGYWFLKGFEIDKIAPNLDYINMMSYDYHGPWDVNITDQAPVANPQSSIEDMHDSALLYVRAKIPLEKTNLGLAYYGRTFKLADPSCKGYGCTITGTGGGAAGECTVTSGYLAQFEIERQLQQYGITPQYDDTSKTYWYNLNGDLITFDQADTWAAKVQFAGTTCFAGSFIWSADQVLPDGLAGSGSGGTVGPDAAPSMTTVVWNPNPYPSPGAASETFFQSAGVYTVTTRTRIGATTSTATETVTLPAWTETTFIPTVVSGTSSRVTTEITHPASIETSTHAVTVGGKITTTTQVVTKTSTVVVIAVPTTSTSIVFPGPPGGHGGDDENVTIILAPGGTPVQAPLPPFIIPTPFLTPSWTYHILPPPAALTVTFTAPLTGTPTYSTTAPVPTRTGDPPTRIDNPPSDDNSCDGGVFFNLLFGGLIDPCMPLDVGIRGGITPRPVPPPGWTGPWINPFPIPTPPPPGPPADDPDSEGEDDDPDDPEDESCALPPVLYTAGPDPENAGDDDDTFLRRRFLHGSQPSTSHGLHFPRLVLRAGGRHIQAAGCPNAIATSPTLVSLGAGTFYSVGKINDRSADTVLTNESVPGRPLSGGASPQEHIFELGYIDQWLVSDVMVPLGCAWYENNIFIHRRIGGVDGNIGNAILARIDNQTNMVWTDLAMNQAKSNVVNNNRNDPNHPPQEQLINSITDFVNSADTIHDVEFFARNIAALGSYFSENADRFKSVAEDVMMILSEITPTSPPDGTKSIPLLFYEWLEQTVAAYPQGGVNRANAVLTAYRTKMNGIARMQRMSVPTCFPVFHNLVTPSSFDYMSLLPRRPPMSECNPPGTVGLVGVFDDNGQRVTPDQVISRTMGSGSTFTLGLGSGADLDDFHYYAWQANNQGQFPRCGGVYEVGEQDPSSHPAGAVSIYLTFACQSQQGGFPFWIGLDKNGGSYLTCVIAQDKATGKFRRFCGTARQDVFDCMGDMLGVNSNNANLYAGVWHFFQDDSHGDCITVQFPDPCPPGRTGCNGSGGIQLCCSGDCP